MKTNKILMAVALPALLAACTAEEIVEQSPVANISGRAMLDPNFSVSVAEGVESRFAWESYNWKFEDGDQFGAAVTDVAEQGKVTGTSLIGNYIFSKNEAGNWITDSQMSEGIYQYYSFDGFKTKQARELVAFDLTGQDAVLSEADAELNKYENQLMITPLYTLQEKYSTKALPLEFYSYYGVGAFKFKNNSGQDLKITQIIFNSTEEMVVKGRVNPKAFENNAKFVYNEEAEKYVLSGVDAAMKAFNKGDITAKTKADRIEDAEEAYENFIYEGKASAEPVAEKGDKTSSFITLDCNNYELKEGKTVTAYMMLPAGEAGEISVEIMVVDEDGKAWSVYVNADGGNLSSEGYTEDPEAIKVKDLETLKIMRHKTTAIFGKTTDGKGLKTLEIRDDNLVENTGYYVDTKEGLLALLDRDLGDILIHNSGDLYIDEDIVEAINEYTGAGVTFSNPIEIKSTEELTEENDLQLSDVNFKELIVKGMNEDEDFEGTVIELGNKAVAEKLTIEAGATVTLVKGSDIEEVENDGTLTVENGADVEEITNDAVLTVKRNGIEIVNNGDLTYSGYYVGSTLTGYIVDASELTLNAGGDVTVGEKVTLNIDEDYEVAIATETNENGVESVTAYSVLTNNGTIVMEDDLTVFGKFVNNGIVEGEGTLTIACTVLDSPATGKPDRKSYYGASVINNAEAEINEVDIVVEAYGADKYGFSGKATVENAGEFGIGSANVKLYGKVTMKGINSRLYVTEFQNAVTDAEGEVDNTENGVIEDAPADMWISAKLGAMTDGLTLAGFDTDSQINKIYVGGKWTVTEWEEKKESAEYQLNKLGIKVVEFTTKNAVEVRSQASLDLSNVKVVVSGVEEVIFSGRTVETSEITLGEIEEGLWKVVNGVSYKTTWSVKNMKMVQHAANLEAEVARGGDVELLNDIKLNETLNVESNVSINMNENTLTGSISVEDGGELEIVNGIIDNNDPDVSGITSNGGLTLDNVSITSARHAVRIESGSAVIYGGEYIVDGTENMTTYALNIGDDGKKADVTIKGGKFVGPAKSEKSDSGAAVIVKKGSTLTIEGGDFSGGKIRTISGEGKIVIIGGTFDQNPSEWVKKGYTAAEKDGVWTVSKSK